MTAPAQTVACAALVEKADPDRFAATMAAPPPAREWLWPLYALNIEVARAAYASDEPLVAEMRLQWWADELGRLAAGQAGRGEVSAALEGILHARPDIAAPLATLVEARRWDCWREPFADRAALDRYLDDTAGGLAWAAALALGAPATAEPSVRDFAWGAGLANWFDAVPALKGRGRAPLPDESPDALRAFAADGLSRIARARAARQTVPTPARAALWPGWSARTRLRAAQSNPARVLAGTLPDPRLSRAPALLLRSLTGCW